MSSYHEAYPLPRATGDKVNETQRLDRQYEMLKLLLGGLTKAPLTRDGLSVLDVGCGTGIWCCEFAEAYPRAQVIGVDVVPPIAPPSGRLVPKNCTFVQANVENDWHFASGQSFDFIATKFLVFAIQNWDGLVRRIYEHLRPGGFFELWEVHVLVAAEDAASFKDSAIMRWIDQLRNFVVAKGGDPDAPDTLVEKLESVGFKVIQDHDIKSFTNADTGASHRDNGAKIATEQAEILRDIMINMGEKVFTSEAQRILTAEALEDLEQNSGTRGYYVLHTHKVLQKPD